MHIKVTHRILFILTGISFILMSGNLRAQNTELNNTLDRAEELRNEKKYAAAAEILAHYENQFPGDLWIEKLYGLTLCQLQEFEKAKTIYQQALKFHPNNPGLLHDYGQLLIDMKDYKSAENLLLPYAKEEKDDFAIRYLLGKIYYYNGHFKKAALYLKKALQLKPNNKEAKDLYGEVHHIISPSLQIAGSLRSDSQPLKGYGSHAVFQYFISNLLQLSLSGSLNHYTGSSYSNNISHIKIGDVFESAKGKTIMALTLGKLYSEWNKNSDWSGDFQIKQFLFKSVSLEGEATRHNYDCTLSGVLNLLIYHTYKLELDWGHSQKWNGMVGSSLDVFGDNNSIITYYVSFLSKQMKIEHLSFAFGYAFNYMNSKQDRFGSFLSTANLLAMAPAPNTVTAIQGTYLSYYTPLEQFSNSIVSNIAYQTGGITVSGKISVGIYAQTNAPSLSLSTQYNSFRILKKYHLKNFVPIDLEASFLAHINTHWQLEVDYTFTKTYFYDSHNLSAGIKYSF